jgi:hypothetical protein
MKKSTMGLALLLSLGSLSLQADVQRVKLSVLGKYLEVGKLLMKAPFLGRPNNDAIINLVVDCIKVGELPIQVVGDPQATVQDYFDTAKAREFIKQVLIDLANRNLTAERFSTHLGILKTAIFKGKKGVPPNVGQDEAERNVQFLDGLQDYLAHGLYHQVNFFEFLKAQQGMPQFLDTLVHGYFDLNGSRTLFENRHQISVDGVFAYITFEPLFRDKSNPKALSDGFKLSVLDLIDFINQPRKSTKDFVKLLKVLI